MPAGQELVKHRYREGNHVIISGHNQRRRNRSALHQHHSHALDGCRADRPIPAIPARPWPWRRSPTRSGSTYLRFDPQDPIWPNRDRFVLSDGHASMLLYSMLHLTGVKAVKPTTRRLGNPRSRSTTSRISASSTASAPAIPNIAGPRRRNHHRPARPGRRHQRRHGHRPALAGRATYNRPGFDLFNYNVYALCGDGCMMEGISSEAASLAGHLQLWQPLLDLRQQPHHHRRQHLAGLYRRRGHALHRLRMERHPRRRRQRPRDARARVRDLPGTHDRPTLIIVDSHIGYGAPHKQDTSAAHGEPLGEEEIKAHKAQLRLARRREIPCPRGRLRSLSTAASARAARRCATAG